MHQTPPSPAPPVLTLLEQIQEGCVTFDQRWHFTSVNDEAVALLRRPRSELLGRALEEVFPEVPASPLFRQLRASFEQQIPLAVTVFHPPRGQWFEIRSHPLGTGLAVSFRDVTAGRAADSALRQSERRFRTLVEQAGDAFFLHTLEGRILDVNRQACASLGASRQLLLGMSLQQIEQGWDAAALGELLQQLAPGEIRTLQGRHRRLDGSSFPVEIRLSRLDLEERPLFSALVRDVSERRRHEQQLQQARLQAEEGRERITAILRSVSDALVVTDEQGRILLMNRSAERLTASSCAEAAGAPLEAIVRQEPLRRALLRARQQAGESGFEVELPPAGEQTGGLTLQGRVAPIQDARGSRLGHISLLRDISRERQVERLKNEFISTAAHELRTPLTSILGFAEILRDLAAAGALEPAQQGEFLAIIYDKAETLAHLIDELLDLGRVEAGRAIALEVQECDLGELLSRIHHQQAEKDPEHSYSLELPQQPLRLRADPRKIAQVLDNLLGNAAKYSAAGTPIRLGAYQVAECCTLEVADAGIGMTAEQLAQAFDKFYRANASDTAREGLGLGLTIARNIVQAHGGRIWIESAPDRGTTVFVQLPCLQPPSDA